MVKPKIQEVFEEKFWKGLLNIFPQSFILLDMKGNLIIHNLNSSGIPWLSEVHLDLVLHKNCQEDPCELQEYLRGAVDSFQQKIPVEDDRILLSRAFTYSFKGKSYCFLLLQDITESKNNETIMKFNERRMRAFLDASPQCFLTVDSRGNVLSVQSRGDGSLPLTESLVGKKVTQILPFQRPKAIANALVQVREGNGLKIINENWLKGDKIFKVEIRILFGGQKDVVLLLNNISNQENTQENRTIIERTAALAEINSAMNKELIENLQNQIRLYNSLELENLNHEERDVFEKIMAVSKDSLAMLKGMFNFSMVQQDEQSKINIQEVITKATEFCKYGLPESIEIKMDDIDKDFQLTLPASQFIGVLIHLIMNAREAIELSGVIEISCEKLVLNINQKSKIMGPWIPGKYYRISIKDNGKGIKEEQINRIFEPLFSTGQGNLPSGMGLRTLKNFIEDMKGGIEVQPQWLIGSTFNLYLPLNFEDTFKKEILLMISDGVKRESLREVLEENMTHNISAITQLEDACDLLKESSNKIDLIILEEDFFNRGLSEDCKKILYGKRVLILGSDQSKMQEYLSMEPEKLIVHELQQGNEQLLKRIGGLLEPTNLSPLDIKTDIPKEQLFFPDRALELLEGNQDLHQTICRDFIIDYGQAVSQIKELLKAKDWEKSRLIVHSIKGLAGLVGSQELQEAARSFEDVLKNQNAPRLNEEFQGFSGILSKVLKEIDQYLEFNDFSENNFSKKEILKILPSELLLEVVEPLRKHLELWEYNESLEVVEDLMNRSKDGEFIESLVPLLERVKQFNFEAALEYLELPEE